MTNEELKQRLIELLIEPIMIDSHGMPGYQIQITEKPANILAEHLIANGVTIRERGEWIPVTERLPIDYNDVLIFTMWRTMDCCFFDKEYECWISAIGSYDKDCVTHWMPLPEAPETEKGGAE